MSTLFDLTAEFQQLVEMIDEDVDEEVLLDTMEGIEGEFNIKMESYCKVIKTVEGQSNTIKGELERLTARKKALDNKVDAMKRVMFMAMKAAEKDKAGGDLFKVSIQKNGGKAPLILRDGLTTVEVPDVYKKVSVDFDKDAIRQALESGQELEFAHLGDRGESLRIR